MDSMQRVDVPARAVVQLTTILAQRQSAEERLRDAIALLAGALNVPDGWQLQVAPDGSMAFVGTGEAT